ncbi:MAG TPA: ferritin-like domain-containing protein [Blastocatellia bacterium]|nr:ferritin-like domain-containing protein [Blastocatellia bacterium]
MKETDWVIPPIPSQARDICKSIRSPRLLTVLLNRICWTEAWAVEALSIAASYFSHFPKVVLNCTRHSADEARHTALFAERTIELGGRLKPYPGRSDMLNLLPGFKTGDPGDARTLGDFMSRGYVEEYRSLLLFEEFATALEDVDPVTQRLVRAIASDERRHVTYIRELLESLMKDDLAELIPAFMERHKESKRISV